MSIVSKIWASVLLDVLDTAVITLSDESAVIPELHFCNLSKDFIRVWVALDGEAFATWEIWPEGTTRLQLPSLPDGSEVTARAAEQNQIRCVASGGRQV